MNTEPYVLVIDDENYICESCDRIFTNAGYRVDTNVSASNGFRQALLNPYDAIILDLKLVESDGLQLLRGIRKKKPDVPVVIITGYPSEETRKMSTTLGAADYITKPFEPYEILEPVQRSISLGEGATLTGDWAITEEGKKETDYRFYLSSWFYKHFYLTSWFYKVESGIIRVGGYLTDLADCHIMSIRLPEPGSHVYRGLPLAEVTLSNGEKQIIPSAVSGKITTVNNQLKDHFYILERNIEKKSWIAVVDPDHFEEDLKASETRSILVFADKISEENEFFIKFVHKGYITKMTSDMDKAMKMLSGGVCRVFVMDARNLAENGPEYVGKINQKFPRVKVIVFNEPNMNFESMYRKHNVFYYGVNPITNNEMVDILHCAFQEETGKIHLKNPQFSRFLPDRISKISITNRFGKKVTLLACNEVLQNNSGLGYLLSKELLDMSFPVNISHSRFGKSAEEVVEDRKFTKEQGENDRIIILKTRNMNKIPGSIEKHIQEYKNRNSSGNLLINIDIQPEGGSKKEMELEYSTILALKELIKNEMLSA